MNKEIFVEISCPVEYLPRKQRYYFTLTEDDRVIASGCENAGASTECHKCLEKAIRALKRDYPVKE